MSQTRRRPLVLRSFETPDGDRCVDIFQRTDGSFGFEGYRRDAEDPSGWYPVSNFADQRYDSQNGAREAAGRVFPWSREEDTEGTGTKTTEKKA